ncbi:MAG: terminase small subunit [Verrucomicrobiaceae bacterium]
MKQEMEIEHPTLDEIASRMTPKQFRFCLEFLTCHRATEAYRRAYSEHSTDAARQGYKVRHSPLVEEYLATARQIQWEKRCEEEERKCRERRIHNYLELMPRRLKSARRKR